MRLGTNWRQGSGDWQPLSFVLASDWHRIDAELTSDWPWIGTKLTSDWPCIGYGLAIDLQWINDELFRPGSPLASE